MAALLREFGISFIRSLLSAMFLPAKTTALVLKVSCMKTSWHEIWKFLIVMHENDISMHEHEHFATGMFLSPQMKLHG